MVGVLMRTTTVVIESVKQAVRVRVGKPKTPRAPLSPPGGRVSERFSPSLLFAFSPVSRCLDASVLTTLRSTPGLSQTGAHQRRNI